MKTRPRRGLCAPELLESRIAPATIFVTSLADDGGGAKTTLREAIAAANLTAAPDTIVFDHTLPAGTITLDTGVGEVLITAPVTVKGPGIDKLTISGSDLIRLFEIDYTAASAVPTVLSGLTLIDGKTANDGGAISSVEALTLSKVVVASSSATGRGGGIFVDTGGKVQFTGVIVTSNESKFDGGGIFVNSATGGLTVSKSNISYNVATFAAGGLSVAQNAGSAPVLIDSSVFTGNDGNQGGAIYLHGSAAGKMTVSNSVLSGNVAGSGGGIFLDDGNLIVSKTNFAGNTSTSSGGAINDDGGISLVVKTSRFTGNRATSGASTGGAIQLDFAGPVSIQGSVFTANEASTNGGAIGAFRDETKLTVTGSIFTGNIANHDGGALAVSGGAALVMKSSTLTGNVARDDSGGAIFGQTGASLSLTSNKFIENHADGDNNGTGDGGAIFALGNNADAVDVILSGNLFQANVAINGGAVRVTGDGSFSSKNDQVIGNVAGNGVAGDGGGFFIQSTQPIFITGSLFRANAAGDDGGGLVVAGTSMLSGLRVIDNVADFLNGFGGGIEVASGTVSILRSIITGNSAHRGGGVCDLGTTTVDAATKIFGNAGRLGPNTDGI